MADISQIQDINGTTYDIKDTTARAGLAGKQDTLTAGANIQINGSTISATDTTYSAATQSAAGLMSAADKAKLDGIEAGADATTVDPSLDSTSTNPVENKAIVTALAGKQDTITAGTGLSKSGNTLNHSNSVTAGWIGSSLATTGNVINMPYAQFDAQGHITNKGTITHTSWDVYTPWLIGDSFRPAEYTFPYINYLNNGFYGLSKRNVTLTYTLDGVVTALNIDSITAMNYDTTAVRIPEGSTGVFTFDFSGMNSSQRWPGYPYGNFYLQFYNTGTPTSVSARLYNNYTSQGVGWKTLPCTSIGGGKLWRIDQGAYYGMQTLEITIVGRTYSGDPGVTMLSNIDFRQSRPSSSSHPLVLKNQAETLYYRLTAPQFAGVFEGNSCWYGTCSTAAGTAAKVVTCSGFVLATGARISVYCSTANSAGAITLNVNSTGAKSVYVKGAATSSSNKLWWEVGTQLDFIYDGTYWRYISDYYNTMIPSQNYTSMNTQNRRDGGVRWLRVNNTTTSNRPMANGPVMEVSFPGDASYAAQVYIPTLQDGSRFPQWRATSGSGTWANSTWDTFYTYANPPAFSDITGTAAPAQLPVATTSSLGGVSPDGSTITVDGSGNIAVPDADWNAKGIVQPDNDTIVSNNGVLTATGQSGAAVCWERRGGYTYAQALAAAAAQSGGGLGFREWKWSDGRLEMDIWTWAVGAAGTTHSHTINWAALDTTPYVTKPDVPIVESLTWRVANGVSSAASCSVTDLVANTSITWSRYTTNAYNSGVVCAHITGWWRNVDPPAGDYVIDNATGDAAFAYNGVTYYPVTDWTISSTGAGGDNRICAAVRFLMSEDSALGQNNIIAQYAAYTKTGTAPTDNGYFLIRRLSSAITTYTADTGSMTRGTFYTATNDNQRQGYCYAATVSNNLLWGDQPYIISVYQGKGAGVTITSETFYVGYSDGPLSQTSISASYTTPTS